jgi:hypothetical protein
MSTRRWLLQITLALALVALLPRSTFAWASPASRANGPDEWGYRTYLPFFALANPSPPPGPAYLLIDDFEYDDSPLLHDWFILDPHGELITVLDKFDSRKLLAYGDFSFTYPGDPGSGQALNASLPFLSFEMGDFDGFWFSVDVVGTDGRDYVLRYQPDFSPLTLTNIDGKTTIQYGLGTGLVDNRWHNIRRNLAVDLARMVPGVSLQVVKRLTYHGMRLMDNIRLRQPPVPGDVYTRRTSRFNWRARLTRAGAAILGRCGSSSSLMTAHMGRASRPSLSASMGIPGSSTSGRAWSSMNPDTMYGRCMRLTSPATAAT